MKTKLGIMKIKDLEELEISLEKTQKETIFYMPFTGFSFEATVTLLSFFIPSTNRTLIALPLFITLEIFN